MKLNNVFEGNSELKSRDLLLQCMREMLLTKQYAPLNVDLFYDQFFNLSKCSNEVCFNVSSAKKAWVDIADNFTTYIDFGIDEVTERKIKKSQETHGVKFVNFKILDETNFLKPYLKDINCAQKAINYYNQLKFLNILSLERTNKFIKENELPNHLPTHFGTYYNPQLNNTKIINSSFNPKRAILESPFAGDITENVEYAAKAITELLLIHNKAPMASHLLYTRMLNDLDENERKIGIDAGLAYGEHAVESIVCVDRGLSTGMIYGIQNAIDSNRPFYCFTLSKDPQIIKEVNNLKNLQDIAMWVEAKIHLNPKLFSLTGDVTNYRYSNEDIKNIKCKNDKIIKHK